MSASGSNAGVRLAKPMIPSSVVAALLVAASAVIAAPGCGRVTAQGRNIEGVRLFQQGQYQGALQKFQEALYGDANNADAYYNLASTYHRLGKLESRKTDLDQAESYYNQCLDHDPDHQDAYRGLAVLLVEQNRSQEAFRLMQNWVDRNPTASEPKIELARLYDEFGDRQAAKERLLEALVSDPYNPRALSALGHIHEELGDSAQALVDYQRSLWHDRSQPEVAARIAALQSTLHPQTIAGPNGTRTVTTPAPVVR